MYGEKTDQRVLEFAAKLWLEHFGQFDNGDTSTIGAAAMAMATMASRQRMPDQAKREKFVAEFVKYVQSANREYLSIDTDYHPDRHLSTILQAAGIDASVAPCKSYMSIRVYNGQTLLSAAFGYGKRTTNYYPLNNGKWFASTLTGSDEDTAALVELAQSNPDAAVKLGHFRD